MSFNVIISTLNSKYIHSCLAPWCLYTSLKKEAVRDVSCRVIEGTINEAPETVEERILSESPTLVAFSCYIWNITKVLSLCRRLKQKGIIIALGGPEVSFRPREILSEYDFVDFVLSGEGEESFPRLIKALTVGKEDLGEGISYRKNGSLVISRSVIADTQKTVSPYCEEYFQGLGNKIAYIESSRGCPFSCGFCLSGRDEKVRFFPIDRVKQEMLLLCRHGAKIIKFVDRTFNCKAERAYEILCFIKEEYGKKIPLGVCFHFEIAADLMTDKLFSVIEALPPGAVQFEAGIQSFNENTLRQIRRKTNLDKAQENIKRLIATKKCHVHIDLIAGLPGEDHESFVRGFERAYSLGAHMLQLGFLKVLYGSDIEKNHQSLGIVFKKEPPYEVESTPHISSSELSELHLCERELDRLYNSSRFRRTLSYLEDKKPAYELFCGFGRHLDSLGERASIPLDKYTCLAFSYFSSLEGVDPEKLREAMIIDRLESNNSGVIPEALKIEDKLLHKIKTHINFLYPKSKGVLRSVAVLYSEKMAVHCDYTSPDIFGRYSAVFTDIASFFETA